jgi:hypothetical protein
MDTEMLCEEVTKFREEVFARIEENKLTVGEEESNDGLFGINRELDKLCMAIFQLELRANNLNNNLNKLDEIGFDPETGLHTVFDSFNGGHYSPDDIFEEIYDMYIKEKQAYEAYKSEEYIYDHKKPSNPWATWSYAESDTIQSESEENNTSSLNKGYRR